VYTYDSTYGARAGLTDGNPTRIITEVPALGGAQMAMTGGIETEVESTTTVSTVEDGTAAPAVNPGGGEAMVTQAWTTPPCRYGGLAIKEVRANVYRMLRVSPRTIECPIYPVISSVDATIPACVSPRV